MKNDLIKSAVIGMGIGFPVTLLCMVIIGGFNAVVSEFLVWMAASALYGILSGFAFFSEKIRTLPAALLLHCLGCLLITMGAAVLCGYIKTFADVLPVCLPFAVIYVLIYGLCMLCMKHNEKQINNALEKK